MVAGAKGKGKGTPRAEEEEGRGLDRISDLPDAVLDDIVSRLPTKDGALFPRWRLIWLSAPLNLDLHFHPIPLGMVPRILSSHGGPARRFSTPVRCYAYKEEDLSGLSVETLDDWLRSPALDNLQELEFGYGIPGRDRGNPPPLPTSALHFSCTLRIARFRVCSFLDGISVRLPLLQELGLSDVVISESSLQALLAGCPVLQTLRFMFIGISCSNNGYSRVRIASPTLRSIDVTSDSGDLNLQQLVIEDAPCLERLHHKDITGRGKIMDILVISAPKLGILGCLDDDSGRFQIGTVVFQGLRPVSTTAVVCSVKVIALTNNELSLDVILNIMRCFPCLEELNIHTLLNGKKNVWGPEYRNLINACEIHLKKLVLINYEGDGSHVNFVKFFVLKARVLESIRLKLLYSEVTSGWIEGQHRLLKFENRASRSAKLVFLSCDSKYCLEL
ncbi:unnamed protein product [Urochloa decumbens]